MVCLFQAEDGIRDLVRSRGLGDVYKRQPLHRPDPPGPRRREPVVAHPDQARRLRARQHVLHNDAAAPGACLLYTSDAADERSSVDLGGRRIIKKKKSANHTIRL